MNKKTTKTDVRVSARAEEQSEKILAAMEKRDADSNEPGTFPRDFSASGTGKGGGGTVGTIES